MIHEKLRKRNSLNFPHKKTRKTVENKKIEIKT